MSARISTPTPSESDAATDAALCRGTLYSALALGFQPPTSETVRLLAQPEGIAALSAAAARLDAVLRTDRLEGLVSAMSDPSLEVGALSEDHRRLFGHTARGQVSPYETEYGDEALFQQPQELSDLAGFLHAFGLILRPEMHERIDHVSCECELLAFLAYKEAYARRENDAGMLRATERAAFLFLRDHLARFAAAFAHRLRRADGGFYSRLGRLLTALLAADCERLGIAMGPALLPLRPDPALAAPMGCDPESAGCARSCPT
jgi:TorA maturation chaperone TorD